MDARDNGSGNPFQNPLCSLEWIACAMDAARRYKEQKANPESVDEPVDAPAAPQSGDAA